ncbi:Uracil DNA glycosylase superfamily protein [Enhygromyxa salina]|uniref:Type-4 uracil-DNA glycosylase n=1 Tax=Enhygromyxa salina TaxID=215803 RepID=A0A2S9XCH4_9BACT|nr:uracil-DNA glycosylase [Enhygromyxa salina]PRP90559.1 Uracil DNA glycosylase superfamily protein [Enhygromyxa salina]
MSGELGEVEASAPAQTDDNPATEESPHSRGGHTQSPSSNGDVSSPGSPGSPGSGGDKGEASRPVARRSANEWPAAKKLAYLRERNVGDCRRCPLAATRRNIVFGVGDPEADLMFVGEAPGADEDRLGQPFVGAAGRRLDSWLEQLGLGREQVYIANVLKCRPPRNRDPQPNEIERCSPFLHAQIRAVQPKVIVALGRFAGCLLLGRDHKLYEMRGRVHRYREPKSGAEIPLVVTYHPSYVLRREQSPRDARGPQARPDRGGAIKSEEQKVLADLDRALSLTR